MIRPLSVRDALESRTSLLESPLEVRGNLYFAMSSMAHWHIFPSPMGWPSLLVDGSTSTGNMASTPYLWRNTSSWGAFPSFCGAGPTWWKTRRIQGLRCPRLKRFSEAASSFRKESVPTATGANLPTLTNESRQQRKRERAMTDPHFPIELRSWVPNSKAHSHGGVLLGIRRDTDSARYR
eukprot:s1500_g13.t1